MQILLYVNFNFLTGAVSINLGEILHTENQHVTIMKNDLMEIGYLHEV